MANLSVRAWVQLELKGKDGKLFKSNIYPLTECKISFPGYGGTSMLAHGSSYTGDSSLRLF